MDDAATPAPGPAPASTGRPAPTEVPEPAERTSTDDPLERELRRMALIHGRSVRSRAGRRSGGTVTVRR